jgi:hypothetical protein
MFDLLYIFHNFESFLYIFHKLGLSEGDYIRYVLEAHKIFVVMQQQNIAANKCNLVISEMYMYLGAVCCLLSFTKLDQPLPLVHCFQSLTYESSLVNSNSFSSAPFSLKKSSANRISLLVRSFLLESM